MLSNTESSPASPSRASTWTRDLVVVTLLALLWFCSFFTLRPLTNPDEGRYAEIPREMVLSGDFVTPRLDGVKYFEKPPLLYWLSALTFQAGGVNEFTARIWNGLFAVLGVVLAYWAGRSLYNRTTGIWSAIILGSSLLYYALGQIVTLDMAVGVTMSGALFTFLIAMQSPRGKKRFWLLMACYVFMALATLTKGLIGFLLPGAIMFLWTLALNRWRSLFPLYLWLGIPVFLAIAAPWHILAAQRNPDFLWFYFVHEHFLRFTTTIHRRDEPFWFFVPCLLIGLFPWIFLSWEALRRTLQGGWKARQENATAWFLVIWIAFIMLFFSKSQSKLIPYIIPVFPAAAVLIGAAVARLWEERPSAAARKTLTGFVVVLAALAIGCLFIKAPKAHPEFKGHLTLLKTVFCVGLLASAGIIAAGLRGRQVRMTLSGVAAAAFALLIGALMVGGILDLGSTKNLALMIKPQVTANDQVYCLGLYPQDLPVYLERKVKVVAYQGELEYGIKAEPELTSDRFISKDLFATDWAKPGRRYAVVRKKDFEMGAWFSADNPAHKIGEQGRYVLVTNSLSDTTP